MLIEVCRKDSTGQQTVVVYNSAKSSDRAFLQEFLFTELSILTGAESIQTIEVTGLTSQGGTYSYKLTKLV